MSAKEESQHETANNADDAKKTLKEKQTSKQKEERIKACL